MKKRPPTAEQQAFLDSEPMCDLRTAFLCAAYARLSSNRTMGAYTIGPIPDWTINDWCDRHGYDDDVAEWFAQVIHIIDADTLERQQNKPAAPRKPRR